MWPLVGKFGKRKVMLIFRAFGALPVTYITMALLADALDHVEWQAGRRLDGFLNAQLVVNIIRTQSEVSA